MPGLCKSPHRPAPWCGILRRSVCGTGVVAGEGIRGGPARVVMRLASEQRGKGYNMQNRLCGVSCHSLLLSSEHTELHSAIADSGGEGEVEDDGAHFVGGVRVHTHQELKRAKGQIEAHKLRMCRRHAVLVKPAPRARATPGVNKTERNRRRQHVTQHGRSTAGGVHASLPNGGCARWAPLLERAFEHKVERLIEQVADEPRAHQQLAAAHDQRRERAHDEVGRHRSDGQYLLSCAVRIHLHVEHAKRHPLSGHDRREDLRSQRGKEILACSVVNWTAPLGHRDGTQPGQTVRTSYTVV